MSAECLLCSQVGPPGPCRAICISIPLSFATHRSQVTGDGSQGPDIKPVSGSYSQPGGCQPWLPHLLVWVTFKATLQC